MRRFNDGTYFSGCGSCQVENVANVLPRIVATTANDWLEILLEVDRICKKHDIKYSLQPALYWVQSVIKVSYLGMMIWI